MQGVGEKRCRFNALPAQRIAAPAQLLIGHPLAMLSKIIAEVAQGMGHLIRGCPHALQPSNALPHLTVGPRASIRLWYCRKAFHSARAWALVGAVFSALVLTRQLGGVYGVFFVLVLGVVLLVFYRYAR